MGNISFSDAQPLFTKKVVAKYADRVRPLTFGRSFFTETTSGTKEISIEVQRGFEKLAVDVTRGTVGNRNSFDKSTEKIFVPPFFREYFDVTELAVYDALLQSASVTPALFGRFIQTVADKMGVLTDKIDRAYEKQAWDVFQTGIVSLEKGTNIDYKRKSESILNVSALTNRAWTVANNATCTPYTDFKTGCEFIRKVGLTNASVFNAILGDDALAAFLALPQVQSRNDIKNYNLDMINSPVVNGLGGVFHGEISAGSYRIRLWTYPQFYTNSAGVSTPYLDPKTVVILPENPAMVLSYAAVPQLLQNGVSPVEGKFIFGDYIDERNSSHVFDVKSAGVAIPVGVDQIYTMKVLV
jgi:hypothetical protein